MSSYNNQQKKKLIATIRLNDPSRPLILKQSFFNIVNLKIKSIIKYL